MNLLTINHLNLSYDKQLIIKDFSFCFNSGIYALVGPSGCGKSSLFKAIITNNPSVKKTDNISFLSQQKTLFNWLNVYENLNLINKLLKTNIDIDKYLDYFNLTSLANLYPHQLSGGQYQRISLLRCFLIPNKIILLDEPFNQIDQDNKKIFYDFLLSLQQQFQKLIIITTHDQNEANYLANTIIYLTKDPMMIKKIITK